MNAVFLRLINCSVLISNYGLGICVERDHSLELNAFSDLICSCSEKKTKTRNTKKENAHFAFDVAADKIGTHFAIHQTLSLVMTLAINDTTFLCKYQSNDVFEISGVWDHVDICEIEIHFVHFIAHCFNYIFVLSFVFVCA